jgi:hypothetical protein
MCVPKCINFREYEIENPFKFEQDINKTFIMQYYDSREIYYGNPFEYFKFLSSLAEASYEIWSTPLSIVPTL